MCLEKKKIAVFMGGPSPEYEISLKSGEAVYTALKKERLNVISVILPREPILGSEGLKSLIKEIINENSIDIVFVVLHGQFGEDGTLQEILEELGVAYTGSSPWASRLSMDKPASREIFRKAGLAVPEYQVIKKGQRLKIEPVDYPLVVKPASQGSSIGVSICYSREDLEEATSLAYSYDERIIVEEYIQGREITVGILGDRALPVIEILPREKFYNYGAKYKDPSTKYLLPAPLPRQLFKRIQDAGLSAHLALGCSSFSRVDMILEEDKIPVILELNSIPGLTATSLLPKAARADGIEFGQLCLKILETALTREKILV